jgi:hypothetical protein
MTVNVTDAVLNGRRAPTCDRKLLTIDRKFQLKLGEELKPRSVISVSGIIHFLITFNIVGL